MNLNKQWRGMFTFLLLACAVHAFAAFQVTNVSKTGGWANSAAVKGDYVYFIQANSISVIDGTSNPLEKINSIILQSEPSRIQLEGDYLYIFYPNQAAPIEIYSLSNPAAPVLVNSVASASAVWPFKGYVGGNRMVILSDTEAAIWSLDNAEQPVFIKEHTVGEMRVAGHDGTLLFLADWNQFIVYDMSDAGNLQKKSALNISEIKDIFVDGNIVWLAVINNDNGLIAVDVSDPDNPVILSKKELEIELEGIHYRMNPQRLVVSGTTAYVGCSGFDGQTLFVVDVSDAESPVIQGAKNVIKGKWPGCNTVSLALPSVFTTLGSSSWGLAKFDVSDPANPEIVNYYEDPWGVNFVFSEGQKLYAAGEERLWVYEVIDGQTRNLLGSGSDWGELERLHVKNDMIYGVKGNEFYVIDATDPANMTEVGKYTHPNADCEYKGVTAIGNSAYLLANINNGNPYIEVIDAGSMQRAKEEQLPNTGRDIFADGSGSLFVAYGDHNNNEDKGFKVFNADLEEQGSQDLDEVPLTIWVDNDVLAVGCNSENRTTHELNWYLESFDVSDFSQIASKARQNGPGSIYDVIINGDYVYASITGEVALGKSADLYEFYGLQPKEMQKRSDARMPVELAGGSDFDAIVGIFSVNTLIGVFHYEVKGALLFTLIMLSAMASVLAFITGSGWFACPFFSGSYGLFFLTITGGGSAVDAIPTPVYQPVAYELHQNYPNPFNPATKIEFKLEETAYTQLTIYDVNGREVKELVNQTMNPGTYKVEFDAKGLSGGLYTYRLNVNGQQEIRKMILLK